MGGAPPEAVSAEKAALFGRQRQLGIVFAGWGRLISSLTPCPSSPNSHRQSSNPTPPSGAWVTRADQLIGPRSPPDRSAASLLTRFDGCREIHECRQEGCRPRQAPAPGVAMEAPPWTEALSFGSRTSSDGPLAISAVSAAERRVHQRARQSLVRRVRPVVAGRPARSVGRSDRGGGVAGGSRLGRRRVPPRAGRSRRDGDA